MSAETMDLLDVLLMRVLDGEATAQEREKLLTLADADQRLSDMEQLRARLRVSLAERAADAPEVVGEVMAALHLEDGWDETAALLRGELAVGDIDVVSGVMDALEVGHAEAVMVSALHDGELGAEQRIQMAGLLDRAAIADMTEWADNGRVLRQALEAEVVGLDLQMWSKVAPAIGVENPEEVPGWEPLAVSLREAVAEAARLTAQDEVSMTAAVMNAIPREEEPVVLEFPAEPEEEAEEQPAWIRWTSNSHAVVFALAMALVLAVFYNADDAVDPVESDDAVALIEAVDDTSFEITASNEAEVEDLEVADRVTASVFQAEEGAPMFLMIDEGDDEEATL